MPRTMTVRNVSDGVYERISALAERERRSLNAQVLAMLDEALATGGAHPSSVAMLLAEAERIRKKVRQRKGAPSSVEILRQSREGRM